MPSSRDEDEPGDPHELILRAAIELVEAQKGLLLSRDDADADGRLDFVCAHGFDHDPARGSVAQRFAREVLEHDRIVREDAPPDGSRSGRRGDREPRGDPAVPARTLRRA